MSVIWKVIDLSLSALRSTRSGKIHEIKTVNNIIIDSRSFKIIGDNQDNE